MGALPHVQYDRDRGECLCARGTSLTTRRRGHDAEVHRHAYPHHQLRGDHEGRVDEPECKINHY